MTASAVTNTRKWVRAVRFNTVVLKCITLAPPFYFVSCCCCPWHNKHSSMFSSVLLSVVTEVLLIFHITAQSVALKETIVSTATTPEWMNMNDYDRIWRRSEGLIKGEHPVTYGNVSQWISGCPGFSFLLLCCWWLSVPDLSRWSLSSAHKRTHILYPHTQHTFTHCQNSSVFTFFYLFDSDLICPWETEEKWRKRGNGKTMRLEVLIR